MLSHPHLSPQTCPLLVQRVRHQKWLPLKKPPRTKKRCLLRRNHGYCIICRFKIRVHYQNPLPVLPCPPKLLDIPTNSKRYMRPEFLDAATNEALLSMVVNTKCGMPLNLGKWEALWEDGADDNGEQMTSPGDIRHRGPLPTRIPFFLLFIWL